MNVLLLVKLLLAHCLGDFVFQPDWLVRKKRSSGKYLYIGLHSLIHAFLFAMLCLQPSSGAFSKSTFSISAIIFISHFIIDVCKIKFTSDNTGGFITDQICHLLVILAIWITHADGPSIEYFLLHQIEHNSRLWLIIMAYVLILQPSGIILNLFITRWTSQNNNNCSLPNAGKWIGYMERLLILTFILTNNMEGVGFLLAAKSIFRFGDLKTANDIKTTEYVLIGTLASFSTAIIIGLLTQKLIAAL